MPPLSIAHLQFDRFFNATKDKLYSFVLKHTRDKHLTEDVMQHCYIKLWENIEQVDEARIENLLFTYARNSIIDHVRKKNASIIEFREVGEDQYADDASAENALIYSELNNHTSALINKLPPKRKQVFILVREYGMSYDEVSEQMGISKLTIKKHMHEALRFLREEVTHAYGVNYVTVSVLIMLAETYQ